MRERPYISRIAAALLVPALVLGGTLSSSAFFRCRMDGIERLTPCCGKSKKREAPVHATIAAVCCDLSVVVHEPAPLSASPRVNLAPEQAPALVADALPLLPELFPVPNPAVHPAERASGPPIVLLTRSLLI